MNTKQLLGLIGSIVLFVGVFTPILRIPLMGNINYFRNGEGDGTIVLILALISLVLALIKKYEGLWFTGIGSLGIILFTFVNLLSKISQAKEGMESESVDSPFFDLADIVMQSIQLQWGWPLLIIGCALIIASAAIKDKDIASSAMKNEYMERSIDLYKVALNLVKLCLVVGVAAAISWLISHLSFFLSIVIVGIVIALSLKAISGDVIKHWPKNRITNIVIIIVSILGFLFGWQFSYLSVFCKIVAMGIVLTLSIKAMSGNEMEYWPKGRNANIAIIVAIIFGSTIGS